MKQYLLVILFALPLLGFGQLYYTAPTVSGGTSAGGWSPPSYWADSLGAITNATMGADGSIGTSEIRILVNTRTANRSFAFTVSAANGYTVKWGRNETAVNYANNATAERTYDSTKCQTYCLITITKTGAGAITAFTVANTTTFVATQVQYPTYLWVSANYVGVAPIFYTSLVNCININSVFLKSCTSIGAYCFTYCYSLQSITIPSSVTSIGANCFNSCYSLQSITIPSSVTSFGANCFVYCYSLQSIIIPSSVTSIGSSCFFSCYSLQSITIPSSVTSIGGTCFTSCYSLQSITIPSSVTSIGASCFNSCYSLQSITIPSSVTSIGNSCFTSCYSLKYLKYVGSIASSTDFSTDFMQNCEQIDTLNFKGVKTQRFAIQGGSGKLNHLGGASYNTGIRTGNLKNDSVPIRLDWTNSTFANGTAPQLNMSYCKLDTNQIRSIIRCLPTVGSAGSNTKQVTFTGCTGAAALSAYAIAFGTAKGWQVLH